ncbi:glutamate receptor ionotropic, kainate glr-3-like [Topomyia yanbarensis]|uniref:glutamate receptor ionotropic, kainate glr-3-like n=1 Tax=Topomyia yanbarensis TaxID=2498891 RepID=UPI00273B21BB|nr:glutamate receptor ionotropic, kainate glr-3-like [Topomyia yanbarensis]
MWLVNNCLILCVSSTLVLGRQWNEHDLSEISIAYFKARHVKLVTVINCFDVNENFRLMKSYLNNGFRVHVVGSVVGEFNVSGNSNTGVVVDARCVPMVDALMKNKNINSFMLTNIYWLILDNGPGIIESQRVENGTFPSTIRQIYDKRFRFVDVLPTSHVVVGLFDSKWQLFDVYKVYWEARINYNEICYNNQDLTVLSNLRKALWRIDKKDQQKRNLRGFAMPSGTAITAPEYYKGLEDRTDAIHDLFAKANYPMIKALMYDLNFTMNLVQVDKVGWKTNGTFSGIMGKFQTRSIELGCIGVLMRSERMEVVDYTIVTLLIETSIIFKQPPLSVVSNIFELPFSVGVWLSCFAFVFIYWLALMFFRIVTKTEPFTPMESLTFIIGTMCQQGYDLLPHFNAAKLLFFFAKLASFFIFTSYSASIVALLQSPSKAINSVSDLTVSPLKAGAMDTVYGWVYFNESKDPGVQALFRRKIKPQGKRAFIEADVGMRRVKDELYAFQVEVNAAYQLIKETFTDQDTCKIHELESFKLPPFSIPVVKGSKYRELFRQRLIRQREVGIIKRFNLIWIAQKPRCENGFAAFSSVGLTELRYAYILMVIGYGVAFGLLAGEIVCSRCRYKYDKRANIDKAKEQAFGKGIVDKEFQYVFLN